MTALTPRMADCLAAIRDLTHGGAPPSWEDLRIELGLASKGPVHRLLRCLRDRGVVAWTTRLPHSLVIIEDQVRPAILHKLSDEALRTTAAHIAGILAQRTGGGRGCGGLPPDSRQAAGFSAEGGIA